jgi:hypothetical protein
LLKYYYHPSKEIVVDTKIHFEGNDDTIFIVIKAESRDEALEFGKGIINMENWVLDHSEE